MNKILACLALVVLIGVLAPNLARAQYYDPDDYYGYNAYPYNCGYDPYYGYYNCDNYPGYANPPYGFYGYWGGDRDWDHSDHRGWGHEGRERHEGREFHGGGGGHEGHEHHGRG